MTLNEKDVLQVLAMFQQSGWNAMQLRSGDVRLSIGKTGRLPARAEAPPAVAVPASAALPAAVAAAPVATPVAAPAAPAFEPHWHAVKAPLLGHFYAAPKPGAPPFVAVGQQVAADDTVAILEVMKLMNHVKAGVAGRVARIAAGDGELVEFEQPLIYIDPVHG